MVENVPEASEELKEIGKYKLEDMYAIIQKKKNQELELLRKEGEKLGISEQKKIFRYI